MAKKKAPTKPLGENPIIRAQVNESDVSLDHIHNPKETLKEKIEDNVVNSWIKASNLDLEVTQNPQNANDYSGVFKKAKNSKTTTAITLELTELVLSDYPPPFGQYENSSYPISASNYLKSLLDRINKKDSRYSKSEDELWLLVYVTHWLYWPGGSVLERARYELSKNPPKVFKRVYFYVYQEDGPPISKKLFPQKNPKEVDLRNYTNQNLMAAKLNNGGVELSVKI